jgi:hypothetical protein
MEWEFTVNFQNACYNDAVSSWTTQAADISYPMRNTYSSGDITDSVASVPVWSQSSANCAQTVNLEIYDDTIPGWKSTGMNEPAQYDEAGACNDKSCTFATTYPWMQMTANSAFAGHANGQIKVDTGGVYGGGGGDNAGQIATYQNTGPVTYQLRWVHFSPRSYSSTATSYDYFNVVITYECDAATLAVSTEIGQWVYVMDAALVTK